MRELIAAYLECHRELGRSPATCESAAFWLEFFARFCEEQRLALSDLTPQVVAAYHTRLLWQPSSAGRLYAPGSVDIGLRVMRAFLRWAVNQRMLRQNPTRHLILTQPPGRPRRVWSAAEKEALMTAPDATSLGLRDRALLALGLNTSLTGPQLAGLDLVDFDPQTYRLAAHRGRLRKGPRELVVGDEVAQILFSYLTDGRPLLAQDDEPALLVTNHGLRYTQLPLPRLLRKYRIPL